jgi:hypothetical protein
MSSDHLEYFAHPERNPAAAAGGPSCAGEGPDPPTRRTQLERTRRSTRWPALGGDLRDRAGLAEPANLRLVVADNLGKHAVGVRIEERRGALRVDVALREVETASSSYVRIDSQTSGL